MILPVIDWDACQMCEPCQARLVCNTRAIVRLDPDEPPYIDPSRCTGCVKCVLACTWAAISTENHRGA
jgi:MinD superfamily P-loop ATPase